MTRESLAEPLSGRQDLLLGIKSFGPDDNAVPVADKLARTDQVRPKRGAFDKCADNDADAAGSVRQSSDRPENYGADADAVNRLYDGGRLSDPRYVPRFGEDAGATIGEHNRDVVRRCVDECCH